jgi:hypothetical protein
MPEVTKQIYEDKPVQGEKTIACKQIPFEKKKKIFSQKI